MTAILYINQRPYEHKWGGWTELLDEDTGEDAMIRPLDNRFFCLMLNLLTEELLSSVIRIQLEST